MAETNVFAGWVCILVGFFAGALPGLFFRREDWLGGYGSWQRRMLRLAHISFFGTGFINLAFGLTAIDLRMAPPSGCSFLFLAGSAAMPAVCYLSAWRKSFSNLFPVPVICLVSGAALLVWKGFLR